MALIRIDVPEEYADRVRAYCKDKRITIKGFITGLIDEELDEGLVPAEGKYLVGNIPTPEAGRKLDKLLKEEVLPEKNSTKKKEFLGDIVSTSEAVEIFKKVIETAIVEDENSAKKGNYFRGPAPSNKAQDILDIATNKNGRS